MAATIQAAVLYLTVDACGDGVHDGYWRDTPQRGIPPVPIETVMAAQMRRFAVFGTVMFLNDDIYPAGGNAISLRG